MNYPYANGIIKAIENNILDYSKFQKLVSISKKEFIKTLIDLGYGAPHAKTLEELINLELQKTKVLLSEISPNKNLTDLFYFQNDAVNIKFFYKRKIFNVMQFDTFVGIGTISRDTLEEVIINEDLSNLTKDLAKIFKDINKAIENLDSPRLISSKIDQIIYKYIFGKINRSPALVTYYSSKVDFTNVLIFLRSKKLRWDENEFIEMFVPGGQISHKVFSTAFSKDEKELIKLFEPFYNEKISKGLAKFGSDLNHLERYFDELIIEIMKSFSFDSFDIGPMIYYFLLKQAEAQNLRIIYATSDIDSLLRY